MYLGGTLGKLGSKLIRHVLVYVKGWKVVQVENEKKCEIDIQLVNLELPLSFASDAHVENRNKRCQMGEVRGETVR